MPLFFPMTSNIDKLKENIKSRRFRTALTSDGLPVLTRNPHDPSLQFVCVEDFLRILKEKGKFIATDSLVISPLRAKQSPTKTKTYTRSELESLSWNELRHLASLYPNIKGNSSKETIISALVSLG